MAPFRQRTIYEVNADLSFFQLNEDVPMRWSKHSEKGMEERRALLEAKMPGVTEDHRRRGSRSNHVAPPRRWRRSSGRQGGSSPRPPSASRSIRSGTSRACGWRSFARTRDDFTSDRSQIEWWVKGRSSSGPANTATAHPSRQKDAVGDPALALHALGRDQDDPDHGADQIRGEETQQDVTDSQPAQREAEHQRQPHVSESQEPRTGKVHCEEHDEPRGRADGPTR